MDFGLLVLLTEVFHFNVLVAASFSYWTSISYNFVLNRKWTFGARGNISRHAVLYSLLLVFNYAVTVGLIYVLGRFGIHYGPAKIISVLVTISWTYFIYKKIIFV
jgi:putative flippase GtrA